MGGDVSDGVPVGFSIVKSKKSRKSARQGVVSAQGVPPDSPLCVFCAELCPPAAGLQCEASGEHYHFECLQMPFSTQSDMLKLSSYIGWSCRSCRFLSRQSIVKLKETVKKLTTELDVLRRSLPLAVLVSGGVNPSSLPSSSAPVSNTTCPLVQPTSFPTSAAAGQLSYSDAVTLVTRTISDTERRKHNIILTGLQESNDISSDLERFRNILKCELGLTMYDDSVISTRRLGAARASGPRRLLVVFRSIASAQDVIGRAKQLRQSADKYTSESIYINSDLSREEARLAYIIQKSIASCDLAAFVWSSSPPTSGSPPFSPSPVPSLAHCAFS